MKRRSIKYFSKNKPARGWSFSFWGGEGSVPFSRFLTDEEVAERNETFRQHVMLSTGKWIPPIKEISLAHEGIDPPTFSHSIPVGGTQEWRDKIMKP